MGYETWETFSLSPSSIDLDPKNPRLPGLPDDATQSQVLEEIFNMGKVREMIKSIAKSGFYPDQRIVVIRKGARGYIAIEGNRRLAACKALLDPEKAPDKHLRYVKKWALAAQPYKASFEKIPVVVAPSRQAAMQLLASRHLNEAPVISWSRYAQGRFAINAFAEGQEMADVMEDTGLAELDLKDCIQEARMFDLFLGLSWGKEEREIIESNMDKFPIEALRRLLQSKVTSDELGAVSIGDDGWVSFCWAKETIEPVLKRFVYDSIPQLSGQDKARLTSRTLNDADGVRHYLSELPQELKPARTESSVSAKELVPEIPALPKLPQNPQPKAQAKRQPPKPKKRPRESALPDDISSNIGNDKATALLEELQTIRPEDFPYATGLLLRSLLEISLIYRMKRVGSWGSCISKYAQQGAQQGAVPSLDKILKFAVDCEKTISDIQLRTSLSNQNSVPRILLNLVAHNDQHVFVQLEARDVANKLSPLIRYLLADDASSA